MPNLHRMFHAGHATIVHAASSSYRDRSHFDGQDVLESGLVKPSATSTGWLNRALDALATEEIVKGQSRAGVRRRSGDADGRARAGADAGLGAAAGLAGERRHADAIARTLQADRSGILRACSRSA